MADDWDETPSTGGFGGTGFGRGKVGGFGRGVNNRLSGFGRGRARVSGDGDNNNGFGGGFGSSKPVTNGNSNGWDNGGASKSNGFGTSEDWGDGDKSSGFNGGFGSDPPHGGGRSGGSGCYKCGGDGHIARDCPDGGGQRNKGCFKCGEEGHMSRECPNGGGGGGGGSRACYKCNEEGHMARDCPSAEGGGGGGGNRACYKCNEEGHMARDCPNAEGGGGGGGGKGCFKCGEDGHFAKECPNPEKEREDGQPPKATYVPPPPPDGEEEIFKTIQMGINFDNYDKIAVECTGDGAPKHGISTFEEGNLHERCLSNVKRAKYLRPTPIQKWAIPCILSGRDIMGCAQTGSGKTAAFLLPVITAMLNNGLEGSSFSEIQEPACIVVGPTRELVLQIRNEAAKFSYDTMLRPVVVYGGVAVYHQLSDLGKGAHIVVGTPGRLMDFIQKGKIGLKKVKYLILDEADRMLDMGFGPVIKTLLESPGMPSKEERQTLLFSATFPDEIQQMAQELLNNYLFITVGKVGGANSDIEQRVYSVEQSDKREKLVTLLNESGTDRTLVFVETKKGADFLATYLSQSEFPATSIHGDRLQKEREEALRDFTSGRAPILLATSVAARGLDIPDVKHVVNYDMPKDIDEYVHRIGRTGRCGNLGKASTFFDNDRDSQTARGLVNVLSGAQQEVPDWLDELAQGSFGAGGFGGGGGNFASTDTRRGKFGGRGGRGGGNDDFNDFDSGNGGFGDSAPAAAGGGGGFGASNDADEEWD